MIRAYVGKDGKPAPYSPDNVPFQSEAHLNDFCRWHERRRWSVRGGFPGRTFRLIPSPLRNLKLNTNALGHCTYQQIIAKLDVLSARSPELKRKADDCRMRLMKRASRSKHDSRGVGEKRLSARKG